MAENNNNDVLVAQLKDDLAKANARFEKMEAKFETQVAAAQKAEQEKLEKQIAGLKVDNEDLVKQVKASKDELAKTQADLEAATKENKKVAAEMDDMKKKMEKSEKDKAKAERVGKLIAVNVPADKAEALVAKFDNLNDEQFAEIVEVQAGFFEKKEEKKDDKEDEKKKAKAKEDAEAKAAAEALEKAKADEEKLRLEGGSNDQTDLTKAMADWFSSIRKNKQDKE